LFSSRFKNSPPKEKLDGVTIKRNGYQYLGVQIRGLFHYLKNRKFYDLVVDQFHGLPFFTPLYVKKPKLAVIQEPAREVWFKNPLPFPFNLMIGFLGYISEPIIFIFYKRVLFMTGSDSAKEDLSRFGIPKKNITVVPHGVLTYPLTIKDYPSRKAITFLGILSKDKGIEDAIEVFRILSRKTNWEFWIIGRPETERYGKYLKSLIKDLGLEKRIKFWGFVDQKKKFELLAKSLVLINPSIREGWGLVNIEANSVGTPVISYNSLGLVDSVKNGVSGIVLKENSPKEMASKVKRVVENNSEWKGLSEGAIEWSSQFSWKKSKAVSIKLLKEIYEEK